MLLRSKGLRALLVVVPLILVALLWNAARMRPRFVQTPARVIALALSHDGSRLAVVTNAGKVIWRESGEFQTLPGEKPFSLLSSPIIQFSSDGETLTATGFQFKYSPSTGAYRWNLKNGKIQWSAVPSAKDMLRVFTISNDGQKLLDRSYEVVKVRDAAGKSKPDKNSLSRYAVSFPTETRLEINIMLKDGVKTLPRKRFLLPITKR